MSNNARVVDGGEIGVAQWLQARAAGVEPDVRMNPVLLKPEADTRSQVVVAGRVSPRADGDAVARARPVAVAADDGRVRLAAPPSTISSCIEGAGSPAEINLPDLVNNRMLAHADAAALLVADIDRGGAFAHLYGTWSTRARRDPRALWRLRAQPLPRRRRAAGARAGAADRADGHGRAPASCRCCTTSSPTRRAPRCAPIPVRGAPASSSLRFPYGSNLDELHLLGRAARVTFAEHPGDLDERRPRRAARFQARRRRPGVAPGHGAGRRDRTISGTRPRHLWWLPDARHARSPIPTASRAVEPQDVAGLGLLPFDTVLESEKVTQHRDVTFPVDLPEPWAAAARADGGGLRDPQRSHARGGPVWAAGTGVGDDRARPARGSRRRRAARRSPPAARPRGDVRPPRRRCRRLPRHVAAAASRPALTDFSPVSALPSTLAPCDGSRDRSGWPSRWARWSWAWWPSRHRPLRRGSTPRR